MQEDRRRSTSARAPSEGVQFELSDRQKALQRATAEFVRREVIPRESALGERDGVSWREVQEMRRAAREAGVYGPHIPAEYGGLGLDWRSVAVAFEEAGVSLLGPLAINGSAPDEGNMHLLARVATPAQKERFLAPLARGEIRSCFGMTEPAPGAGSDPTMLRSRATRVGDGWEINGHKWWTTGAQGAAFCIVMARTGETPDPRRGATMFLVPTDTPGFKVERNLGSLDHAFFGGHGEVTLSQVRVGADAVLGEVDRGFEYAQVRLAPARLTHCMRWLGVARRSLEIAAEWATRRTSEGRRLGDHQMIQAMLADCEVELHAARLMVWHAAWVLDTGGPARAESSMAKVFVAETVNRVVDRAIQVCGGLGVSEELPLARFYREVRPFRIYDGPSEVHRAAIARRVLRRVGSSSQQGGRA